MIKISNQSIILLTFIIWYFPEKTILISDKSHALVEFILIEYLIRLNKLNDSINQ